MTPLGEMIRNIFVIALLILCGCRKTNEPIYFEHQVLERVARLMNIGPLPSSISFLPVYVISSNDSIAKSNFEYLRDVYDASYKSQYSSYTDFLFDAVNHRIKLNTNNPFVHLYYTQKFKIDPKISSIYKNEHIEGLINRYTVREGSYYTLKRDELSIDEINSISFYFFINQYIRHDDDYYASIQFRSLSISLDDRQET